MSVEQPIIVCRIGWMPEYRSIDEPVYSNQAHFDEEDPIPHEGHNFLKMKDGKYYGYFPITGDAVGSLSKTEINKLGASSGDDYLTGTLVLFVAPKKEDDNSLRVVGFYRNATLYREPETTDTTPAIRRMETTDAVLIPEEDRAFVMPRAKDRLEVGGFGRANHWYGLNEPSGLRDAALAYVANQNDLPNDDETALEYKKRKLHKRMEGRANVRHWIAEKGYCCEACDWSIEEKDVPIWGSGFELHHLLPWSKLEEGMSRILRKKDFAVLCATCHRAIHQTEHVSDVAAFRTQEEL